MYLQFVLNSTYYSVGKMQNCHSLQLSLHGPMSAYVNAIHGHCGIKYLQDDKDEPFGRHVDVTLNKNDSL